MPLPQLRSSAGIAALRVERSVISETSRSQGNQFSLRSDGDAVLSYSRTNGIWKLPLNVWPYRCKTAQSTRFFARFPCASICDGVSPACGDSHVSQIVGLKQFTFIGNQTNSTIEASIFRLLGEDAWLIHNKNSA
jgi:hypothetical protein